MCIRDRCKLVGGETAEMPITYTEDNFDLAGFSLGVIEGTTYPKTINSGDLILGLPSTGVHSNGFTLIGFESGSLYEFSPTFINFFSKILFLNSLREFFKLSVKSFDSIRGMIPPLFSFILIFFQAF